MSTDTLKTLGLTEEALFPTPSEADHLSTRVSLIDDDLDEQTTEVVPRISTQKRRPKDYARSFISQKFALHTHRAQVVFERVYSRTDSYLTYLTVSIADRGMLKLAERLETELNQRFKKIELDIDAACAECDHLFDDRQVAASSRKALSDKTRVYDVPLRTNFSARFLKLFARFDELLSRIEALWIHGIVRASGRAHMITKWDRLIRNFTGQIRRLRDQTSEEIKKLQAENAETTSSKMPVETKTDATRTESMVQETTQEASQQSDSKATQPTEALSLEQ